MAFFAAKSTALCCVSTGVSNNVKILSDAALPFIATWKKEPNKRSGIKNSEESRINKMTPNTVN